MKFCMYARVTKRRWSMVKSQSPDPPFISHYAIIQGEMGLFLTFSVFELQRGYLYQNGVEFRQKVIGAGLNLFWGHLHYFSGGIWTFPLLSDTYASAPIAERAIAKLSPSPSCKPQLGWVSPILTTRLPSTRKSIFWLMGQSRQFCTMHKIRGVFWNICNLMQKS